MFGVVNAPLCFLRGVHRLHPIRRQECPRSFLFIRRSAKHPQALSHTRTEMSAPLSFYPQVGEASAGLVPYADRNVRAQFFLSLQGKPTGGAILCLIPIQQFDLDGVLSRAALTRWPIRNRSASHLPVTAVWDLSNHANYCDCHNTH